MAAFTGGFAVAFTLGFFYFIGAVPAGVASGLNPWTAALAAWLGYTASCGLMVGAGAPLRDWIAKKLRIPAERDPKKWIWKTWSRFGLPGLALIAPISAGPQAGPILALLAGEKPGRTFWFFALAALPWSTALALAASGILAPVSK
jgi:hypothetical protein